MSPAEDAMESRTTPAVERAVARLLGASADEARAAVAALDEQGALAHGVLLLAVMGAARWGTDAPGALRRLGEGAAVPGTWSDYELRVAAAEADDERDDALARVRVDASRAAHAVGLDEAVDALLDGAGRLAVSGALRAAEEAFLRALCARVGAECTLAHAPEDGDGVRVSDTWLDILGGS